MAAREGWLTLAVGALAFVGLTRHRTPLRKWKGWARLAGWIGVTFLGQMGVWFLMDKLFLSYSERLFTPLDHFNLPAILSAVITLTAGWFVLRRHGGGKVNPA